MIENTSIDRVGFYNPNKTNQALYVIFCVLTLGIGYLIFEWFPKYKLGLYDEVNEFREASLVICFKEDDEYLVCELRTAKELLIPHEQETEVTYFRLYKQLYCYNEAENKFKKIENEFYDKLKNDPLLFHKYNKGLTTETVNKLQRFYGKNEIDIKVNHILIEIWNEVKTPIMVFEFSAAFVFAINDYFWFAMALFVFVAFTCISIASDTQAAKKKMYEKANTKQQVEVTRIENGTVVKKVVNSMELVIGDLVTVKTKDIFTCDMFMMNGTCLVSEAILTGESNPISKTGVLNHDIVENTALLSKNNLYSGADCVLSKTRKVNAIVIRAGWNTSKGNLIADIMNTKATEFKFKADVYKILGIMLIISMICCLLLFYYDFYYAEFSWSHYIDKCLEILTTALPPALFFSFTIGLEISNKSLKDKQIYSLIIEKINEAGRVKFICFDKTGTLTETTVKVSSYLPTEDFEDKDISNRMSLLYNSPNYRNLMEVMSCCHSLSIVNQTIAGDPLDEEMFKATKFILEEEINDETNEIKLIVNPSEKFKKKFNLDKDYKYVIKEINEFTSERKCTSAIIQGGEGEALKIVAKGAAERIRLLCKPDTIPGNYSEALTEFSEKGYRVIALAIGETEETGLEAEKDLTFIGFVLLINPLKESTEETIKELKQVDIDIAMVTGDNVYTSLNVSFACGMMEQDANVFVGEISETGDIIFTYYNNQVLKKRLTKSIHHTKQNFSQTSYKSHTMINYTKTPQQLFKILQNCKENKPTRIAVEGKVFEEIFIKSKNNQQYVREFFKYAVIFARTNPDQKSMVINTIKDLITSEKSSYCVAFVGDGSNDCKALKNANVGLSLGSNESSIASPFNTDVTNISPVIDLLLEGRSSLEVAMQNFKFIMIASFFQFLTVVILSFHKLDFTNADYYLFDIFTLIPLSTLMANTKNTAHLNRNLPRISIINGEILTSIFGHLIFTTAVMFTAMHIILIQINYKDAYEVLGDVGRIRMDYFYFYQNKYMMFVCDFLAIVVCLAVNRGYPFRKKFYTNFWFMVYVIGLLLVHLYILFDIDIFFHNFHYYFTVMTRQPFFTEELRIKFSAFIIFACSFTFLYEKFVNAYFLKKKRTLNALVNKQKIDQLAAEETQMYNELLEVVSLN